VKSRLEEVEMFRALEEGERVCLAKVCRRRFFHLELAEEWLNRTMVAYQIAGNFVVAIIAEPVSGGYRIYTGAAKRNPRDSVNYDAGKLIALSRAIQSTPVHLPNNLAPAAPLMAQNAEEAL
jgi:hypothetical protein